jgi:hypothetical protein
MPTKDIKVSLPGEMLFDTASKVLGVAGISANKLINTALRLYNGEDRDELVREIQPQSNLRGSKKRAKVDAALVGDTENAAWAVRVGLGMAMGMEREQAEEWASTIVMHGGKREGSGRPRKTPAMEGDNVA